MRSYEATSQIAAPPDAVWSALIDGDSWPSWDSGVTAVDGKIDAGETIKIRTEVAPGRVFPVKVAEFQPPRRLMFRGGMPLGLFTGVRTYDLTPADSGGTLFRVREEYTGPMLPLIWRTMPDLGPSFTRFAEGLKRRVETGA